MVPTWRNAETLMPVSGVLKTSSTSLTKTSSTSSSSLSSSSSSSSSDDATTLWQTPSPSHLKYLTHSLSHLPSHQHSHQYSHQSSTSHPTQLSSLELTVYWRYYLHLCLLSHLHADIIPIIQGFVWSIGLTYLRHIQFSNIGYRNESSFGICLHRDELFVTRNYRIQVFDPTTGRFLRQWGQEDNDISVLYSAISLAARNDEIYVYTSGNENIQVFNVSDCRLLRSWHKKVYGLFIFNDLLYATHATGIVILCPVTGKEMKKIDFPDDVVLDARFPLTFSRLWVDDQEIFVVNRTLRFLQILDTQSGGFLRRYNSNTGPYEDPFAVLVHGEEVFVGTNKGIVKIDRWSGTSLSSVYDTKISEPLHNSHHLHNFHLSGPSDFALNIKCDKQELFASHFQAIAVYE